MTAPVVPRKEAIEIARWACTQVGLTQFNFIELPRRIELALRAAEEADRERCARVCEDVARRYGAINDVTAEHRAKDYQRERASLDCAAAIRAMGDE